ncbi:MAG: bifunctional diaminohydroxyphosphoribosylaminopyrimidine deaminase/5-amino-6-(5-phosphoribosylamino)uracil reductase RibD, partial [Bacteroidota bacterium]
MDENNLLMHRCFELAATGLGQVSPNPMVGAVLIHDGKIIGEGFHQQFGAAHAEVNAIINAEENFPELISKSSLFVNLEPCSHFGKTPPCADLIIQKGIKKVFISNHDPNPLVSGKGIKKLREAGVTVTENILTDEGRELNKRFFTFHEKHRPFIILKWAQTADGFIAPSSGNKMQISSEQSQILVHKWRSEEQAILVGKNTALTDNPQLNVRLWNGKNPIRLVIDSKLSLPNHLHLFDNTIQTIVFNSLKNEEQKNIRLVKFDFAENVLQQILSYLFSINIQSVIIEGGTVTLQKFIDANLWDEARIFIASKKL